MKRFVMFYLIFGGLVGLEAMAQGLQNGSFEEATVNPGGGFVGLPAGSEALDGWSVLSGNVDYIGTYWEASDGDRSVDLNGNAPGAIAQELATVPGTGYVVTFDLAGNPDGGPALKTVQVSADALAESFSFDVTGHTRQSMGWTGQSLAFTATSTMTMLQVSSQTAGAFGPVVDNVVIAMATSIGGAGEDCARLIELEPGYPNPVRQTVRVPYTVQRPMRLHLHVYDVLGREVGGFVERRVGAGRHEVRLDVSALPSGTYLVRLTAVSVTEPSGKTAVATQRFVVIR